MDPSPTKFSTLSLHDALPIYVNAVALAAGQLADVLLLVLALEVESADVGARRLVDARLRRRLDRKSTRLNSSHVSISYAVFCLKKKKKNEEIIKCFDTFTT